MKTNLLFFQYQSPNSPRPGGPGWTATSTPGSVRYLDWRQARGSHLPGCPLPGWGQLPPCSALRHEPGPPSVPAHAQAPMGADADGRMRALHPCSQPQWLGCPRQKAAGWERLVGLRAREAAQAPPREAERWWEVGQCVGPGSPCLLHFSSGLRSQNRSTLRFRIQDSDFRAVGLKPGALETALATGPPSQP